MSEHKSGRPYKRSLWLNLLFGLILALAFQTPLWAAPGDNPQEAAGSLSAPSAQAETSASLDQSEGALLAQAEPDKASAGPSRKHKRHKVGGAPTQVRRGAQPSHHKHGKKHLKASHKKSRKDHAGAASSAKEVGSFSETMKVLWQSTGLSAFCTGDGYKNLIMIGVSLVLIYLAIAKGFEPLLLLPIGIGGLLSNIPNAGIAEEGGFLYYIYEFGIDKGIFPLLIFMGVGAMTDFGPLIANPRTALLGGAAQFGIFFSLIGALVLSEYIPGINFNLQDAASIGIIGGADGPTAIFLTSRLSPRLLGSIAVAAYSYMALVPIIQPPIMKALTTEEERNIVMKQLRPVSKTEKIIFPITVILLCALLLPSAAPLIGCLMFGNLARECGAVNRLSDTMQNALCNIVTILLGTTVGSKLAADKFLTPETLGILLLGLVAFCIGTASGVLLAKLMNKMTKDPINPLIGAAGVSAVPMAARVVNGVGLETNPRNFLLMHAMGPNVSGVIGSAVAAGILLAMLGGGF